MTRRRRVRALAVALALAATAGCNNGGDGSSGAGRRAEVNTEAPLFTTHDLDGKKVTLKDFRGNLVVLNFWASWCTPCRKEFPLLAEADARDRVVVLGVVFNDTVAKAKQFMTEHGGTWPGLKDDGSIAKAYRVGPGIPATIVIGPGGLVLLRHIGELRSVADLKPGPAASASTTTR
jgi:cytochrome c biogenesis protein CcmG/thiol:disulfide interchange protein DsbE